MKTFDFQQKLLELENSLKRFAYSLTSDKEEAKDLVQETYLKALTYQDKYVNDDNFKAWTFTIMRNTFINNYRRSARQQTNRDETKNTMVLNHYKNYGSDDPSSSFSTKEIMKNIDSLEDDFKLPLKMHFEGYKYKEIADKLNLNIGTVKSRIFFSRKKLTGRLQGYQAA